MKEIDSIKRLNLHLHTNVSDGNMAPVQLVHRARQLGLDLISITDHDTSDAYHMLSDGFAPLRILPGMEISSQLEGHDVHILAYGYDLHNEGLNELTEMYLIGRKERAIVMIEKLGDLGIDINLEEVVAVAGSRELIVRPHIAHVLVSRGYCATKNEAFDKYIGNFKPAYAPKPEVSVQRAIEVIHSAKGVAIVAHPGKLAKPDFLDRIIAMGIDGLEVWHPDHYQFEVDEFTAKAKEHGLYMTAGSDFHGENDKHNRFDVVPASDEVLSSVNKLWREYKCRVN